METRYHDRAQDVVGVDVKDLREFRSAGIEEFWQFVVGEFFAAGSFWVGVDRFFNSPNYLADPMFWVCVVAFIAGIVIGYFGYRQLSRRKTRMDDIIAAVERRIANNVRR